MVLPDYVKKPIKVEAVVYKEGIGLEDGFDGEEEAYASGLTLGSYESPVEDGRIPYILTLEGKHYIQKGDYIITGVRGERYPCKADIFEETYEPIYE